MNIEKVIIKLKHLSRVMREVEKNELPLAMETFYERKQWEDVCGETIHTCGTPACVLGYAVLDEEFVRLFEKTPHKNSRLPAYIWEALCREWGDRYLFDSIFSAEPEERREEAEFTELLSDEELDILNHLNSDEPTAKDAADYIDLLIEKIGEGK